VEEFDFADLLFGASMLLRIGGAFVIAVLNDSGFVAGALEETYRRSPGL